MRAGLSPIWLFFSYHLTRSCLTPFPIHHLQFYLTSSFVLPYIRENEGRCKEEGTRKRRCEGNPKSKGQTPRRCLPLAI